MLDDVESSVEMVCIGGLCRVAFPDCFEKRGPERQGAKNPSRFVMNINTALLGGTYLMCSLLWIESKSTQNLIKASAKMRKRECKVLNLSCDSEYSFMCQI